MKTDSGIKLTNLAPTIFTLFVVGVFVWASLLPDYTKATLQGQKIKYTPAQVIEVPYADSMYLGSKVLYDGTTWIVIKIE